jgi:hypothetical protein
MEGYISVMEGKQRATLVYTGQTTRTALRWWGKKEKVGGG